MIARRLMSSWAIAAIAMLGFTASANAKPPEPMTLQIIDLTDDFDRIWDASAGRADVDRMQFLQDQFARILPGFYDAKRVASFGTTPEKYAARLQRKIADYPQEREGIARVSSEFRGLFAPAIAGFEAEFGAMRDYPPIYIVHSMGEFDGGLRDLQEGTRLLFGADVIDRLHKGGDIRPFFHHELFHLYHQRRLGSCEPLWCSLWNEGLAVYVSSRLNPGASDASLLLDFPKPIRAAVDARRHTAMCELLKAAASTAPEHYGAFFTGSGSPPEGLPVRAGYYAGYLVAADLGRTRSLVELASLSASDAAPLVLESLKRLGDCE